MTSSRSLVPLALLLLFLPSIAVAETKAAGAEPDLVAADQLFRSGKFAEAEAGYAAVLKAHPNLVAAHVGLVRSMLREQKVDESLASVAEALNAEPGSAALLAAKGDVEFRLGDMAAAEISYLRAQAIDAREVHARLGLARLYAAYSLYRRAYDELEEAHTLAPDDVEVQRAWLPMLPRKQRLAALQAYLAGPHPDDQEQTRWLTEYLTFLNATMNQPIHACRLVGKVEQAQTKLEAMFVDPRHIRGVGLGVKLNSRGVRLLLDTGAGGILVNRKIAEKAGLTRISAIHFGGIGDKGRQTGYMAVADHIQIGQLQFQDCVVEVSDRRSVADEDGLIGSNVFSSYLVDIDIPDMRLKLSPLPKRPDDAVAPTSLNSQGAEQTAAERLARGASSLPSKPVKQLPRDRYIAPEMAGWTKVFRFGHTILIPTSVNASKAMLFAVDTGAFNNILSVRAGRQVTKVSSDETVRVRGLNGEVKKVYSSDQAELRFAHFQQRNLDIITLDLSSFSRDMGTEVSGLLGLPVLRMFEIKLDYRDGLVDFGYDPKHVSHF